MRALSQGERKQRLKELMQGAQAPLMLAPFTVGKGPAAARAACKRGLEGIVSKSVGAPYADVRTGAWLKFKCVQSDEYAIIGT